MVKDQPWWLGELRLADCWKLGPMRSACLWLEDRSILSCWVREKQQNKQRTFCHATGNCVTGAKHSTNLFLMKKKILYFYYVNLSGTNFQFNQYIFNWLKKTILIAFYQSVKIFQLTAMTQDNVGVKKHRCNPLMVYIYLVTTLVHTPVSYREMLCYAEPWSPSVPMSGHKFKNSMWDYFKHSTQVQKVLSV